MELNQNVLNEFSTYLKKEKYVNKIEHLKLEFQEDGQGMYIYLILIKIKKSQINKGYGSAVMSEIVQLADKHNVRIKLWATPVYGSELKRLTTFYKKHGFYMLKKFDRDCEMQYKPKKVK